MHLIITFITQYMIPVIDTRYVHTTSPCANKKKVHQHWIELDGRDKLQRCESKKTQSLKWAIF